MLELLVTVFTLTAAWHSGDTQEPAQPSSEAQQSVVLRAYFACIKTNARQFAASGESADLVAGAALTTCSKYVEPALDENEREVAAEWVAKGIEPPSARVRQAARPNVRDQIVKAARNLAVLVVVRQRSAKK